MQRLPDDRQCVFDGNALRFVARASEVLGPNLVALSSGRVLLLAGVRRPHCVDESDEAARRLASLTLHRAISYELRADGRAELWADDRSVNGAMIDAGFGFH